MFIIIQKRIDLASKWALHELSNFIHSWNMIKIITDLLNIASFKPFLSAPRQIYKRLCWSISWMVSRLVGQLVGPSISRSVSLYKTFFGLTSYRFALERILAIHLFLFALLILKRLWLHDVILRHLNPY